MTEALAEIRATLDRATEVCERIAVEEWRLLLAEAGPELRGCLTADQRVAHAAGVRVGYIAGMLAGIEAARSVSAQVAEEGGAGRCSCRRT